MTNAAMRLIGDDRGRLPEEWMERIGDDNLAAQNPGAMTSRRTGAARGRRPCTASSSPRYAARGIGKFMPPAELCRTGPVWRIVVTLASALAYTTASVPFGIV
jgi:hypothetical protein